MKGSIEAVTLLSTYIAKNVDMRVFKYKKDVNLKNAPYICLNSLQFSYNAWHNSYNVINVNVHYPSNSDGSPNVEELNKMVERVFSLIPQRNATTEDDDRVLMIKGYIYEIENDSNCMEDTDGTFFVNIRVCVTF